jgi:hypothetical protein
MSDPPFKTTVWAIAVAVLIPTLGITFAWTRVPRDNAPRLLAVAGLQAAITADIALHERALLVAARRLAAAEALPEEFLQRTLAETAAGYAAFTRLYVADPTGRVLAAWTPGAEGAAQAAGRGTEDPSAPRRAAMKAEPFSYFGVAGKAGAGERFELAQPVRKEGAAPIAYVAADMAVNEVVSVLDGARRLTGARLGLITQDGRVIYGADSRVPDGAWRSDPWPGLELFVAFAPQGGAMVIFVTLLSVLMGAGAGVFLVVGAARKKGAKADTM